MAIDKIQPVHAINRYLWYRIQEAGLMDKNNYSGLVPIIPVEETPEFITILESQEGIRSYPYIVYSWSKINTGQAFYLKSHNIAYSIRSADDEIMGQLLNLFEQEFESYDTAAINVNEYIAKSTASASVKRYNFTYINVQVLGAPMPSGSENGVSEALVTISANYTEFPGTQTTPIEFEKFGGGRWLGPEAGSPTPIPESNLDDFGGYDEGGPERGW